MPDAPRRQAAALRYTPGERTPEVTAAGAGLVADRIVEEARRAGVPVRHAPQLAESLTALGVGADVPEPLWRAVAEALAWAYRLDAGSSPSAS